MGINKQNRWLIAMTATLLMIVLGTVYAWSFFQKLIVESYGWSNASVAWAFSTSILCLGIAAAWGGINLPKHGPAKLAVTGAFMYGSGYILSAIAFSFNSLPLLIFGFGFIGGAGLGLGYVTPVVTASKWFPDKKGLVTGMVIMGFGFGALFMSKIIAPAVLEITEGDLVPSFIYIGLIVLVLGLLSAIFIKDPPSDYIPEGCSPPAPAASLNKKATQNHITAKQAILTSKFFFIWLLLFINVTAGIMFIGFQSPLMQDIMGRYNQNLNAAALAGTGATLIAISSLFNGIGRLFWGGLSDRIGRIQTFRIIIGSQIIAFTVLLFVNNPYLFGAVVCYVMLCYGGGFGTMPSFVLDVFGAKLMAVVYGAVLTAWSLAGIAGPQIIAVLKDHFHDSPSDASFYSFTAAAALLCFGFIVSLFLNNRPVSKH